MPLFASWHCRHCGSLRSKFPPSLKKWKKEELLSAVRNWVLHHPKDRFSAEEIASSLRARKDMVHHALHFLNLEGLVSQRSNVPPHDSRRDPWHLGKGDSSWQASFYQRVVNTT